MIKKINTNEIKVSTAVITYMDENYERHLLKDFLFSLRYVAQYAGKIIILDYGMSELTKKRIIEEYEVEIIKCKKETLPVFSIRNKHIPKVINDLPTSIKTVMVVDSGDVWFQSSINDVFSLSKDKIGYVEEPICYGNHEWSDRCLSILEDNCGECIKKKLKGKHVKNSGMVCGERTLVADLLEHVFYDMQAAKKEYFGVDQIFFNYELCRRYEDRSILLDDVYNYVVITHKDEFIYKDGVICNKKGEIAVVVHNAGGKWRLLNRYEVNDIVQEQYSHNRMGLFDDEKERKNGGKDRE